MAAGQQNQAGQRNQVQRNQLQQNQAGQRNPNIRVVYRSDAIMHFLMYILALVIVALPTNHCAINSLPSFETLMLVFSIIGILFYSGLMVIISVCALCCAPCVIIAASIANLVLFTLAYIVFFQKCIYVSSQSTIILGSIVFATQIILLLISLRRPVIIIQNPNDLPEDIENSDAVVNSPSN